MIVHKLINFDRDIPTGWPWIQCGVNEVAYRWLQHAFQYPVNRHLVLPVPHYRTTPLTVLGRPVTLADNSMGVLVYIHTVVRPYRVRL